MEKLKSKKVKAMSDVWCELEERLKQKAKSLNELVENSEKFQCFLERLASYRDADLLKAWRTLFKDNKWVRLEYVKKELQQLKQNYAIIRKDDLASIIELFKSSPFVLTDPLIRRLEELLRENDEKSC